MAATELRAELGHSSCDKDADSDVIKHEVSVMSSGVTPEQTHRLLSVRLRRFPR